MNIRIRDNARNVTVAPTKMLDNPLDVLRDLKRQVVWTSGQCEYECDQEFLDTVQQHDANGELKELQSHAQRVKDGIAAVYEFEGIPLVVRE